MDRHIENRKSIRSITFYPLTGEKMGELSTIHYQQSYRRAC